MTPLSCGPTETRKSDLTAQVFRQAGGPILSAQYRLMIRTERTKARERKKYDAIELRAYGDEEIRSDGAGIPAGGWPDPVRPVPLDDPHRAHQGPRTQEV